MPARRPSRARGKTGTKTGTRKRSDVMVSPISGAECPTGAHAGNTGGKKGRSGRKPDEFKAMCERLATSQALEDNLWSILEDPTHQHFMRAAQFVAEHRFGRPTQPMSGEIGLTLAEVILGKRRQEGAS